MCVCVRERESRRESGWEVKEERTDGDGVGVGANGRENGWKKRRETGLEGGWEIVEKGWGGGGV